MRKIKLFQSTCTLVILFSNAMANYTIHADQSRYDHLRHIAIFRGHVEATESTQRIQGDELRLYLNTHNQVNRLVCIGHPAHYDYASKKHLQAKAYEIRFNQKTGKASFIDHAQVIQDNNSVSSDWIDYWTKTNTLKTVHSSPRSQTHIILQANEITP